MTHPSKRLTISISRTVRSTVILLCGAVAIIGCAPRAKPLTGVTPTGATLPTFELPPGHRRISFKWELNDNSMLIRGDGVARIAPPDSARVDLVVGGGFGGASVALIGDSTRFPRNAMMTHMIPPAPLLWATLGRLALPALSDTVIRVSGDTLRADIGKPAQWRITSIRQELTRVERISDGRIVESVDRSSPTTVRYEASGRRSLVMTLVKDDPVAGFEQTIWTY
jgi:hypothetical protein